MLLCLSRGGVNDRFLWTPLQKMDIPITSNIIKKIMKKKFGNPPVRGVRKFHNLLKNPNFQNRDRTPNFFLKRSSFKSKIGM